MQIYLQLEQAVAAALHAGRPQPAADAIQRAARELGLDLEPLHPGTGEPSLQTFFLAHAGPGCDTAAALSRLRGLPGVRAAYTKPADEAP